MVEKYNNSFGVQPLRYLAQDICYLVVGTLQVLYGHVIASKCSHPLVSNGIQVGSSHHVSEGIVIGAYGERFVLEVFFELVVTTHLRARNSNFEEWYFFSPPFNSRLV